MSQCMQSAWHQAWHRVTAPEWHLLSELLPTTLPHTFYLSLLSPHPVLERRNLSIREDYGLAKGHTAQPDSKICFTCCSSHDHP